MDYQIFSSIARCGYTLRVTPQTEYMKFISRDVDMQTSCTSGNSLAKSKNFHQAMRASEALYNIKFRHVVNRRIFDLFSTLFSRHIYRRQKRDVV